MVKFALSALFLRTDSSFSPYSEGANTRIRIRKRKRKRKRKKTEREKRDASLRALRTDSSFWPYSEGAINVLITFFSSFCFSYGHTLERRSENRIEGRSPPSPRLRQARKKNRCYCSWAIFLAGKSSTSRDLFWCCDLFFFSPEMRFLVFPM